MNSEKIVGVNRLLNPPELWFCLCNSYRFHRVLLHKKKLSEELIIPQRGWNGNWVFDVKKNENNTQKAVYITKILQNINTNSCIGGGLFKSD